MADVSGGGQAGEPRVAAVVVTYHRPRELRLVVDGLLGQTRMPDRIILFDNGGPERANHILADVATELDIVQSAVNLGGAAGFRGGLQRALEWGADWIWLMDDDAIPAPDALARLLARLPELPADTGALGCGVREEGDWAPRHRRRFEPWTGWETSLPLAAYQQPYAGMDTGSFVGLLVAAMAVRAIGLPEAGFFMAYDDTEYSLRLRWAGWRLWLVPGSVIEHLRSPAARLHSSPFGEKHYYNIRNRLIVKRRYARLGWLATVDGWTQGLVLWVWSGGWRNRSGWRLLWAAVADGVSGRLGRAPEFATGSGRERI